MTAVEMARALERCQVPDPGLHHAQHLEIAWVYLSEYPTTAAAADRMAATLQQFAASVGEAEKYHHTMTVFWMRRLAAERIAQPGASLSQILQRTPALLDKSLPLTYYSPGRLFSAEARRSWLDPDLKPLDDDAPSARAPHPSRHSPDRVVSRSSA